MRGKRREKGERIRRLPRLLRSNQIEKRGLLFRMSMRRATSLLSGRTQALRELLGAPVAIEEYVVRVRAVFVGCGGGMYIGPFSDRSGAFVGGFTGGRARFSPFPNSSRRGIPPNSAVCPSCHRDRTVLAVLLALICVRLYKSAAATGPGVRSESLSSFSRPTSPGLVFVGSLRRVPSLRWLSSSVCVLWVTSRRLRPR